MITEAKMPYKYWAEAISTANYLQNLLPTKPIETTPYEVWHGVKPDLKMLRVFDSSAYVFIPKEKRNKLEPKSTKLTFVGYSLQHKAWKFIDTTSQRVVISHDARFLEAELDHQVSSKEEEVDFLPIQAVTPGDQPELSENAEDAADDGGTEFDNAEGEPDEAVDEPDQADGEPDEAVDEPDDAEGELDAVEGESDEADDERDGAVGDPEPVEEV